jgi:cell wall-associated NlpC family hydrolase
VVEKVLKKHLIATLVIGSFFMWTSSALAAEIKVQKGDSLWAIARKHGTTVQKIKETNGLKSDMLRIGQVLQIPDVKTTSSESKPTAEDELASRSQNRMDSLIKHAISLVGSKYRAGGASPKGFDCSGFVSYVYKQFGVSLARSSASQFSSLSQKVEKSDLLPGDLVFFRTSGKRISHVGIYIGNNEFVHSSTPKTGVIISGLSESYYSTRYAGARRVALSQ